MSPLHDQVREATAPPDVPLRHQVDALVRAGVAAENIHVDHAGGAKASCPQLDLALARLREGDVLVITRLDRLGRSVLHLITLGAELRERGIGLKVLAQRLYDAGEHTVAQIAGMLKVRDHENLIGHVRPWML
ncbi:recombinase family protein [Rhodococcus sp. ZPP]|uniref:recombinase family protein n=1 Tax=Rhodococcus sp. ZPP TaxID=2749906 RepID=UPI00244E0B5D|nr:recombinase family protein [Rhodococcus sp. ZPP]